MGFWDKAHRIPDYWVSGSRRIGGMRFIRAEVDNSGNHRLAVLTERHKMQIIEADNRVAIHGAEQSVVVKKAGNSVGAKGLRHQRQLIANLKGDEL